MRLYHLSSHFLLIFFECVFRLLMLEFLSSCTLITLPNMLLVYVLHQLCRVLSVNYYIREIRSKIVYVTYNNIVLVCIGGNLMFFFYSFLILVYLIDLLCYL